MRIRYAVGVSAVSAIVMGSTPAAAQTGWFVGDWSLTLGAAIISAPEFEGDDDYRIYAQPLVSFGRQGSERRFSSRNDNISIGIFDTGNFRAGPTGKLIFGRDADDSDDLIGLNEIRFGGEIGAFAEYYPSDWLRIRGEVRHGVRAHSGVVADIAADAFTNISPTVQISAGPRLSYAGEDYFEAYYGVSPDESVLSGLPVYTPDSGFRSVGIGAAIKWDVTDQIETSLFGEYSRLLGPAADSEMVRRRGSENQLTIGLTATYRFDFSL